MLTMLIGTRAVARTPTYFGVNVEVQDHYERCNLWDWLVDSGATVIREFHPETYLRREPLTPEQVSSIRSKADFERWRAELLAAPDSLPWGMYRFSEAVPWLGVPDGVVRKVKEGKMEPVISMGYYPRMFAEPLLHCLSADDLAPPAVRYEETCEESPLEPGVWDRMPADGAINWRAAASAYEYYFAFMYHFARDFGVQYFNLHNEPEFHYRLFHYPPELMPDPPRHYQKYGERGGAMSSYMVPVIMQMAVLSRIAQMAGDDVRAGLKDGKLTLASPAWAGAWKPYWELAHPHVDICDHHCYTQSPEHFAQVHRRVTTEVSQTAGKRVACTEYGRKAGAIRVSDLLFDIEPALEAAGLMMAALSFTHPDAPPCEFTTFYHFQFPATHRNYKNLVYGDMNLLDWSGQVKALRGRGEAMYPSFEQLQVRFPTAAYHMFRMLARCAPSKEGCDTSLPVLEVGVSSAAYPNDSLRTLAVDAGQDMLITIQNLTPHRIGGVEIDLKLFPGRFKFAVVRETSQARCDHVVAQLAVKGERLVVDLAAQSLTQVILTPLALDTIESLRLEEQTITPGDAAGLGLHQTTIWRALGRIEGREHELSQVNVVWESSDREALPVYQGGLMVCMLPGPATTTINAKTFDGAARAEMQVKRQ